MIDRVLKKYTHEKSSSKDTQQHKKPTKGSEALHEMKAKLKPTSSKAKSSTNQNEERKPREPSNENEEQKTSMNTCHAENFERMKTQQFQEQTSAVIVPKTYQADSSMYTGHSAESLYISSEEERLPKRSFRRDQRRKDSPFKKGKRKEGALTPRERSKSPMKDAEMQTNETQEIGVQTFADFPSSPERSCTIDIQSYRSETAPPEEGSYAEEEEGPSKHELRRMEEKYYKNLQKLLHTVEDANNSIEKHIENCNDRNITMQSSPKILKKEMTAVRKQSPARISEYSHPFSRNTLDERITHVTFHSPVPSPLLISPIKQHREMESPFFVSSPLLINPVNEAQHQILYLSARGRPHSQYPITEDTFIQVRRPRNSSQVFASRLEGLDSPISKSAKVPAPPPAFRDETSPKNGEETFNLPITPPLTSRCPTIWRKSDWSGSSEALSPTELQVKVEKAHKLKQRVHKIDQQFGINYAQNDRGIQTSVDFNSLEFLDDDVTSEHDYLDKEAQTTLSGHLYRSKTLLMDQPKEPTLDPMKYIPKKEHRSELDIFKEKFGTKPKKEIMLSGEKDKFLVKREDEYCRVKRKQIDKLECAFDFMDDEQQQEAIPSSEPEKQPEMESDAAQIQQEPAPELPEPETPSPLPQEAPAPIIVPSSDEGQQKPVKVLIKRFDSFEKKPEKNLDDIKMTPPRKTKWEHPKKESRKTSPSPVKGKQAPPKPVNKQEMFPAPKSKFDTTDDEQLSEKAGSSSKKQSPNVRARREMFETRENVPSKPKDENNQTVIIRKESAGLKDFLKKNPRQAIRKSNERHYESQPRPPTGFNSSSEQI